MMTMTNASPSLQSKPIVPQSLQRLRSGEQVVLNQQPKAVTLPATETTTVTLPDASNGDAFTPSASASQATANQDAGAINAASSTDAKTLVPDDEATLNTPQGPVEVEAEQKKQGMNKWLVGGLSVTGLAAAGGLVYKGWFAENPWFRKAADDAKDTATQAASDAGKAAGDEAKKLVYGTKEFALKLVENLKKEKPEDSILKAIRFDQEEWSKTGGIFNADKQAEVVSRHFEDFEALMNDPEFESSTVQLNPAGLFSVRKGTIDVHDKPQPILNVLPHQLQVLEENGVNVQALPHVLDILKSDANTKVVDVLDLPGGITARSTKATENPLLHSTHIVKVADGVDNPQEKILRALKEQLKTYSEQEGVNFDPERHELEVKALHEHFTELPETSSFDRAVVVSYKPKAEQIELARQTLINKYRTTLPEVELSPEKLDPKETGYNAEEVSVSGNKEEPAETERDTRTNSVEPPSIESENNVVEIIPADKTIPTDSGSPEQGLTWKDWKFIKAIRNWLSD